MQPDQKLTSPASTWARRICFQIVAFVIRMFLDKIAQAVGSDKLTPGDGVHGHVQRRLAGCFLVSVAFEGEIASEVSPMESRTSPLPLVPPPAVIS